MQIVPPTGPPFQTTHNQKSLTLNVANYLAFSSGSEFKDGFLQPDTDYCNYARMASCAAQ